jgi:hypothetical protein
MKKLAVLVLSALLMTVALAAEPVRQDPAASPPKDAKQMADPASIAGKWLLTVHLPGMPSTTILDLKIAGKKVTGTMTTMQMGSLPIKGDFDKNKLKFSLDIDMGGTPIEIDFEGKLKEDGSFMGTAIVAMLGEIEWKATRRDEGM